MEKQAENQEKPSGIVIPEKAPFGATIFWGVKGVGKTLACLNSPWLPIHIIDTEFSSEVFFKHQKKLIDKGIINAEFTRAECSSAGEVKAELERIEKEGLHYGTIIIDTGGQWSEWVALAIQDKEKAKMEKQSQIVWGSIRTNLRDRMIRFSKLCNCFLLTAHEREYRGVRSPRCNPSLLEITSMSIRLTRQPNQQIPSAQFVASRLPFFPPRIENFKIEKLLKYFDDPADWNNLKEDELIPPEPSYNEPPEPEE